jgi:hypothetical protein
MNIHQEINRIFSAAIQERADQATHNARIIKAAEQIERQYLRSKSVDDAAKIGAQMEGYLNLADLVMCIQMGGPADLWNLVDGYRKAAIKRQADLEANEENES